MGGFIGKSCKKSIKMAKAYYFIPLVHISALETGINFWAENDSQNWLILTGLYSQTEVLDTSNSVIYSIDRVSKTKNYIKNGFTNFVGQIVGLYAFEIEGDLETIAPEIEAYLLSLDGVQKFYSNQAFLNYITD